MGGGGGDTPAVSAPTPAPTRDDAQAQADTEASVLRRRGRKSTNTGASGEPTSANYVPSSSILTSGGNARTLGSMGAS